MWRARGTRLSTDGDRSIARWNWKIGATLESCRYLGLHSLRAWSVRRSILSNHAATSQDDHPRSSERGGERRFVNGVSRRSVVPTEPVGPLSLITGCTVVACFWYCDPTLLFCLPFPLVVPRAPLRLIMVLGCLNIA